MNKEQCIQFLNEKLRRVLISYHADSGMTQEELAEKMRLSVRAFSALENGEYGFSVFSLMALLAVIPEANRISLFNELCQIMDNELDYDQ